MIFQKILLELKHSQNPKLFVNLNLKPAQSCFVSHKHKILYKF